MNSHATSRRHHHERQKGDSVNCQKEGNLRCSLFGCPNDRIEGKTSLFLLGFAVGGHFGHAEQNDLLARVGAHIVVHAGHFKAVISLTSSSRIGLAVSIRWVRTCLSRYSPFRRKALTIAVRGSQDALEADDQKIADQMSLDIFRPPAHVILLKSGVIPWPTAASISPCVFMPSPDKLQNDKPSTGRRAKQAIARGVTRAISSL